MTDKNSESNFNAVYGRWRLIKVPHPSTERLRDLVRHDGLRVETRLSRGSWMLRYIDGDLIFPFYAVRAADLANLPSTEPQQLEDAVRLGPRCIVSVSRNELSRAVAPEEIPHIASNIRDAIVALSNLNPYPPPDTIPVEQISFFKSPFAAFSD